MNETDGNREMRAEAAPNFDAVDHAPLPPETREQGGEFYQGADGSTGPHLERELGAAAAHGYVELPSETTESSEVPETADDDGQVYDIWDRRNETSGSVNLRNFGR